MTMKRGRFPFVGVVVGLAIWESYRANYLVNRVGNRQSHFPLCAKGVFRPTHMNYRRPVPRFA